MIHRRAALRHDLFEMLVRYQIANVEKDVSDAVHAPSLTQVLC